MDWLNYHHLHYFWVVAREGSVTKACDILHLSQPTISGQIRELEKAMKAPLFTKSGRGLALTETGQAVFRYADDIFALGRELMDLVSGRPVGKPIRFQVGVVDVMPKLIALRRRQIAFRECPLNRGLSENSAVDAGRNAKSPRLQRRFQRR